jgi:HEAT repeat protein
MSEIYDQFHSLKNENEADVSQNFVIPLLTKYLGFSSEDIKPERNFSARDIFYGRNKLSETKNLRKSQRPDYVVCINDISNPKFVVESKAPNEDLEKHLPQLKSYAIGVGVNFLVITNGVGFRIYDVNHLIFEANDIKELDLKFNIVKETLSKDVQSSKSPIEIIKNVDIDKALDKSSEQIIEEERRKRHLKISDFEEYLKYLEREFQNWQIPREFQFLPDLKIEQYFPDRLHRFQIYETQKFGKRDEKKYILAEIEQKFNTPIKIFIGPSGIGKTTLLKYITYIKTRDCLSFQNTEIPIYIPLRNFGANLGLKDLIISSLEKGGFNASSEELSELLQKHSFFFLLDAFDEVQEKYLEDLKREIEDFVGRGSHKFIVTSREIRAINLPRSSRFLINSLEQNEIENLLELYFGGERFRFWSEIERKGLVEESKNTLLLTLMILIYKEDRALPPSRTKIVGKNVEKIKEWEESKGERLTNGLSWEVKEKILSELAYKILVTQKNLTLSKKQVDSVLIPLLDYFEESREVSRGIDKYRVMDDLALTGIVSRDAGTLSFWHRAFLNYFASKALADKYLENPKVLENIKNKLAWEPIIIGSAEQLYDSTKFVETIKGTNIFLASACMAEARNISVRTIKDIVSQLATKCSSRIGVIRSRAIYFLKRIDPKHTMDVFFDILENNKYPYVRKIALEEVAKEKSNRAKRAVYKFIDWDEGGLFLGSTQGSIAKALSNFDVDDQLKSIEIWRKKTDIITGEDCREAIRSIIREERLTERVKKEVLDFYLEKVENDIYKSHKESGLADILIEIGDENFVPKLIESFETRDPQNLAQGMRTADILAGYKSNQVIEQLSSKAIDQKNSNLIREECSAALSKSKGNVSLSIFEKLLEDKSPKVRRNAVKGLDRFSSAEVKNLLLKHVNDERWVQYEAMKALGDKGLLVELMKTNKSPKRLYNVSVEILLEQIRKYKLREMLPVLDWLKDKVCEDDRRLIDIAHTYCVIEEKERAKEIIESFSHENELAVSQYGLADLAEISPNFDPPYSLRIIKEVFKSIDKLGDKSFFWEDKCVNSLERIGGKEALDILKDLAKRYAAQKHIVGIERTLRSINRLATNRDEGWYIKFIKSNPHLERSDLNRAIEGLGIVGSKKSIPVIMEIAALHRMEEYIPNACFLSIENIYEATGILTEITEKDIFKK